MKPESIFRWLLAISIILTLLGLILEYTTSPLLPPAVQEVLDAEMQAEITTGDLIMLAIGLPALAVLLAGYIGLFLLKPWGRACFIFSSIAIYLITPLLGSFLMTGVAYMSYDLASVCIGAIVAMAYLSPVKDIIERRAAPQSA